MNHRAWIQCAGWALCGLLAASAPAGTPAPVPPPDKAIVARAMGVKPELLTVSPSSGREAEGQARPDPRLPASDHSVRRYAEFLREAGHGGHVVRWSRAPVPPAKLRAEGFAVIRAGVVAALLPLPER